MSVLKNDRETFKPELEFSKEELAEMEREKNKVLSEFVYNTFELEEFTTKKVQNYSGRYRHRQPDEVYHLVSSACSKIRQGNDIHPRFKEQAIKREDTFEDAIRDLHEAVTKLDIVSRLAKEDQGEKGEKKYGGKKMDTWAGLINKECFLVKGVIRADRRRYKNLPWRCPPATEPVADREDLKYFYRKLLDIYGDKAPDVYAAYLDEYGLESSEGLLESQLDDMFNKLYFIQKLNSILE